MPDEFDELFRTFKPTQLRTPNGKQTVLQPVTVSKIRCQHCAQPLPLSTFNTLTLREAQWGD